METQTDEQTVEKQRCDLRVSDKKVGLTCKQNLMTYLYMENLRGNPWYDILSVSTEIGNFLSHDWWFQNIATTTILTEPTIVQIHHEAGRLVV